MMSFSFTFIPYFLDLTSGLRDNEYGMRSRQFPCLLRGLVSDTYINLLSSRFSCHGTTIGRSKTAVEGGVASQQQADGRAFGGGVSAQGCGVGFQGDQALGR